MGLLNSKNSERNKDLSTSEGGLSSKEKTRILDSPSFAKLAESKIAENAEFDLESQEGQELIESFVKSEKARDRVVATAIAQLEKRGLSISAQDKERLSGEINIAFNENILEGKHEEIQALVEALAKQEQVKQVKADLDKQMQAYKRQHGLDSASAMQKLKNDAYVLKLAYPHRQSLRGFFGMAGYGSASKEVQDKADKILGRSNVPGAAVDRIAEINQKLQALDGFDKKMKVLEEELHNAAESALEGGLVGDKFREMVGDLAKKQFAKYEQGDSLSLEELRNLNERLTKLSDNEDSTTILEIEEPEEFVKAVEDRLETLVAEKIVDAVDRSTKPSGVVGVLKKFFGNPATELGIDDADRAAEIIDSAIKAALAKNASDPAKTYRLKAAILSSKN